MDKYNWLQVIGFAPPLSPASMIIEACGLSWLVEEMFPGHVRVDEEEDR
jgi:hypothetical protein